jgi:SAM-dependent methyltransferase
MDASCARYLNEHLGVRAVNSDDPANVLATEDRAYDAICLWHSVEHMTKPWEVLEQAAHRLRQGGILLVAAPNPESWQARVLRHRWPHHDLPRHLFGLPIRWLLKFGHVHGLTPALVTTRDEGSLYWNRFTWAMLARSRSPSRRLEGELWRWGMRFGRLLEWWEGREGNGATYTVILKRENF